MGCIVQSVSVQNVFLSATGHAFAFVINFESQEQRLNTCFPFYPENSHFLWIIYIDHRREKLYIIYLNIWLKNGWNLQTELKGTVCPATENIPDSLLSKQILKIAADGGSALLQSSMIPGAGEFLILASWDAFLHCCYQASLSPSRT